MSFLEGCRAFKVHQIGYFPIRVQSEMLGGYNNNFCDDLTGTCCGEPSPSGCSGCRRQSCQR